MNTTLRVALAQIAPRLGDLEANIELHERKIAEARAEGASLVVFPELSLTGYLLKDMVPAVALPHGAEELDRFAELSRDIGIVLGLVYESRDHRFYNAAAWFENGRLLHIHRKVYLPTYGLFDEQRYFARGARLRAFETGAGPRTAILICEDLWHLSTAYIVTQDGASLLLVPSSSPGRGLGPANKLASQNRWEKLNRSCATNFSTAVIYCNRVGYEDGLNFWGGSEVVLPTGETAMKAPLFEECLLVGDVPLNSVRRARMMSPVLRDENLNLTIAELQRIERERFAR